MHLDHTQLAKHSSFRWFDTDTWPALGRFWHQVKVGLVKFGRRRWWRQWQRRVQMELSVDFR